MPKETVNLTADQHRRYVIAKMELKKKSLQALFIDATDTFLAHLGAKELHSQPTEVDVQSITQTESALNITDAETPWVERLLYIVRFGRLKVRLALRTNLDAFGDMVKDFEEVCQREQAARDAAAAADDRYLAQLVREEGKAQRVARRALAGRTDVGKGSRTGIG